METAKFIRAEEIKNRLTNLRERIRDLDRALKNPSVSTYVSGYTVQLFTGEAAKAFIYAAKGEALSAINALETEFEKL